MPDLLHHRNPFVRKATAAGLRVPRLIRRLRATEQQYADSPPVLANSFPKSGTHLLDQIVAGLPGAVNLGAFLSSMTSSFQMRERSTEDVERWLESVTPGELVRAHLFYEPEFDAQLQRLHAAHYFIYRDPRDVIVSSVHYLSNMNPWHRLHKHFKRCRSQEEAILLSIRGLQHEDPSVPLPNVAERFARYEGWINLPSTLAVRYEDLTGPDQPSWVAKIVAFYAERRAGAIDQQSVTEDLLGRIDPAKSHTYRKGRKGGWREAFTPACVDAFKEVTGDLLVRLGYESDDRWSARAEDADA